MAGSAGQEAVFFEAFLGSRLLFTYRKTHQGFFVDMEVEQ